MTNWLRSHRFLGTVLWSCALMSGCTAVNLTGDSNYSTKKSNGLVLLSDGRSVELAVSPAHGGEISGLRVFFRGAWHELIYRAKDYSTGIGFRGKASILWPATGVSITADGAKNQYELDGDRYPMPFHGFARDQQWRIVEVSHSEIEARAILNLTDSIESRQYYPFAFDFQVEYRLADDRVSVIYTVRADKNNTQSMPFSIGNHITFNVPLIKGSSPDALRFSSNQPNRMLLDESRSFNGQVLPTPFPGLHALGELPRRRSVSLGGAGEEARLSVTDESGFALLVSHRVLESKSPDAVRFNLWSDLVDGFFCPQPWVGTQNSLNSKLGIVTLEPGKHWQWRIDLSMPVLPAT